MLFFKTELMYASNPEERGGGGALSATCAQRLFKKKKFSFLVLTLPLGEYLRRGLIFQCVYP